MAVLPLDPSYDPYSSLLRGGTSGPMINTMPSITNTSLTQYLPQLPSISSFLSGNQTATGLPRIAEQAGGLALLGYAMRPQEDITVPSIYDMRSPYGTSAANYLQGAFTSPADPFAPGGTYSQYLPLLQQQENELLNNAQQRIIAGQPGSLSTAMGGNEIEAIRSGISNYLLPQRYKLFADLQRENLERQRLAANTLYGGESALQERAFMEEINAAVANARSESERNAILGALGTALLLSGRGGTGTATGGIPGTGTGGTGNTIGDAISRYLGGLGTGGGLANIMGLAGSNANPQLAATIANQVGSALGIPASSLGGFTDIGNGALGVLDQQGNVIAQVGSNGQITNSAGQVIGSATVRDFGLQGAGLLGPAGLGSIGALLSSLGSGAAGYFIGDQIGGRIGGATDSQALGTLGGAASGAAAGFAVGGPVGAAIGAITGALGGFFDTREQQHEIKEAFRQEDISSQADQTQEIGSFFFQRLSGLGVNTSGFESLITEMVNTSSSGGRYSDAMATQERVADVGGQLLLQALKQVNPSISSLNDVPGLREEFIDYLTRSTFSASNSSYSGGAPLNQFQPWWEAGLAEGGRLPAGGEFIVGERGPELLRAAPGTEVLPFLRGADGTFSLDPTATARSVVPPGIFLPDVSRAFETPALTPAQSLLARPITPLFPNPSTLTPGVVPAMLEGLRRAGTFPGQGPTVPRVTLPFQQPRSITATAQPRSVGRPAFAGQPSTPLGPYGNSLLARALQVQRTQRRRKHAPAIR